MQRFDELSFFVHFREMIRNTPRDIPRKRFGRTELAMPVFSCGGMRYQQSWKDIEAGEIDPANQANLEATIHRSLELGINHIETARGYGTSEMQLGRILPKLPREQMIIQTKIGPRETAQEFLDVFTTCMQHLKLEYVDLLGIHGINNDELLRMALKKDGTLSAVRQLQKEGRVRFVGFSTHGPVPAIVEAIDSGEFDYVNLHWYYVNPFTWPAIEAATRQDMGVFIISPNDKGGKLYEPSEKMRALCAPLTPMQFNDLYCLSRHQVHTLSLGAARPTDFDEHVEGLRYWDSRSRVTSEIDSRLQSALVAHHGGQWMEHWATGLPEWTKVPGDINVHEILRLWTYGTGLDLLSWAKMRYNLLGQADHWFPGNNAAAVDPESLRAALTGSSLAERIPSVLQQAHQLFFEAPAKRASESD